MVRRLSRTLVAGTALIGAVLLLIASQRHRYFDITQFQELTQQEKTEKATTEAIISASGGLVTICVVCCGNERLHETLTMTKSALLLSRRPLRVIILTEDDLKQAFEEKLSEWEGVVGESKFKYELRPLRFPNDKADEWRKLFKPCAAQRLFLPDILTDIDSVLYVDTDVLFVDGPERTWRYFDLMNSTQMAALAPEHQDPNVGWYNRFANHPYYPPLGVNSGVMLMNLTKMRAFGWTSYVGSIYQKYKLKITWGDQDIINIIFHNEPHRLLVYGCEYNLRSDHCMYGGGSGKGLSVCQSAEKNGAAVVHGNRGYFHRLDRQPAFALLYGAFKQCQITPEMDLRNDLLAVLESSVDSVSNTTCGRIMHIFINPIKRRIDEISKDGLERDANE